MSELSVSSCYVAVQDRWGHSPLDEATRVQAGPVIRYLAALPKPAAAAR